MRVLVTGGTGFVGAHLVRSLLRQGHHVRLMGRDFGQVRDCLEVGAVQVQTDLRDTQATTQACAGVEAVLHVGALSSPWGSLEDFMAVNVAGTNAVLAGCLRFGVRRLIHVSSPAVIFTGLDHVLERDDAPYPARFSSHYALTKKLAEEAVLNQKTTLEVIVLRPKAIYGPGDRALLPRLVSAAKAGRLPQIGDGKNLVDLTHVKDVVAALECALHCPKPKTDWPVFTITGGEHVPLWPTVKRLLAGLGIRNHLPQVPVGPMLGLAQMLEWGGRLTGREPRLTRYSVQILARTQTYDVSRAQDLLGFKPQVSLEQGLQETLQAWGKA